MCVIVICETRLPSEKELREMWTANPDGAGIAWFKNDKVYYKKGFMKLEHLTNFINTADVKLPCVLHFRVTTAGSTSPQLTHPFIVSKAAPNPLEYTGECGILFHNGHWGNANEMLLQLCVCNKIKIPSGEMSDSRIIAFLSSYLGISLVKYTSGKFVYMKERKIVTFGDFFEHNGIKTSNNGWKVQYNIVGDDWYSNWYLKEKKWLED